jgi:hypothetical protein
LEIARCGGRVTQDGYANVPPPAYRRHAVCRRHPPDNIYGQSSLARASCGTTFGQYFSARITRNTMMRAEKKRRCDITVGVCQPTAVPHPFSKGFFVKHDPWIISADDLDAHWDDEGDPQPHAEGYYVVCWPAHVLSPRLNDEATYHGPFETLAEAEKCRLAYGGDPDFFGYFRFSYRNQRT